MQWWCSGYGWFVLGLSASPCYLSFSPCLTLVDVFYITYCPSCYCYAVLQSFISPHRLGTCWCKTLRKHQLNGTTVNQTMRVIFWANCLANCYEVSLDTDIHGSQKHLAAVVLSEKAWQWVDRLLSCVVQTFMLLGPVDIAFHCLELLFFQAFRLECWGSWDLTGGQSCSLFFKTCNCSTSGTCVACRVYFI